MSVYKMRGLQRYFENLIDRNPWLIGLVGWG